MMWRSRILAALAAASAVAGCAGGGGSDAGNAAVYDAWRAQRSNVEVTASGAVARIFGTRLGRSGEHEGFLLHLRGAAGHGLTVRVEDNVDITGPIQLQTGDDVEVRGEYIFDPSGGIVHYTHHDPRGHHSSGYVKVRGRLYSQASPPHRIQSAASDSIL
jgi:hypothetical protein